MPPAADPADPFAAKVRIINRVKGGWVDLYPPDECRNGERLIDDGDAPLSLASGRPRRAQMLGTSQFGNDSQVVELAFRPGQVVNIGLGGSQFTIECGGGLSFAPHPATQYEFRLVNEFGKCMIFAAVLSEDAGSIVRTPFEQVGPAICKRN